MSDLRSRYYLGECGEIGIGAKFTEIEPGQLNRAPDSYDVGCPFEETGHDRHVMREVTEVEYRQWELEDDLPPATAADAS